MNGCGDSGIAANRLGTKPSASWQPRGSTRRTSGVGATVLQVSVVASMRAVVCFSAVSACCLHRGLLADSIAFPPRITVVRATRKGEGKGVVFPVTLYPARWRTSAKKQGSLTPPAALSCGATPRRAGGGHARQSLASHFRSERGKSVSFGILCGVSGKSPTTAARLHPLRDRRCGCRNNVPPPRLKG